MRWQATASRSCARGTQFEDGFRRGLEKLLPGQVAFIRHNFDEWFDDNPEEQRYADDDDNDRDDDDDDDDDGDGDSDGDGLG